MALDNCRRRVQQEQHGRRGRRRIPSTRPQDSAHRHEIANKEAAVATDGSVANDRHVRVEAIWGIYQRMITVYRQKNRKPGKLAIRTLIDSVTSSTPNELVEVRKLGRTLKNVQRTS
ncbi:MAG: transposase [Propionibacteriaceae bacterium]|nr:transposase [Propionibacteriaceae bacterium]